MSDDEPVIVTRDDFGVPKCEVIKCPQCKVVKGRCTCVLRHGGFVNSDCACRFAIQRQGKELERLRLEFAGIDCEHRAKVMHNLRKERDRYRACHEAELGVCQQHCDVVQKFEAAQKRFERVCSCGSIVSGAEDFPCAICGETGGKLLSVAYVELEKLLASYEGVRWPRKAQERDAQ